MALNLSKLFGRGGNPPADGAGLLHDGHMEEGEFQGRSGVHDIHMNQGNSGTVQGVQEDVLEPVLNLHSEAPHGETAGYFEDSVRTAREASSNGVVDGADFLAWQRNQQVDAADLAQWKDSTNPGDGANERGSVTFEDIQMSKVAGDAGHAPGFQVDQKLGMPDYFAWQENLRSSNPPPGILPYIEQQNLFNGQPFTGSEDQLRTLVDHLESQGLIDTSTGEIVGAHDTASHASSDEELGALISWIQSAHATHGAEPLGFDRGYLGPEAVVENARQAEQGSGTHVDVWEHAAQSPDTQSPQGFHIEVDGQSGGYLSSLTSDETPGDTLGHGIKMEHFPEDPGHVTETSSTTGEASKWELSEFDASKNEVAVETLEVTHEASSDGTSNTIMSDTAHPQHDGIMVWNGEPVSYGVVDGDAEGPSTLLEGHHAHPEGAADTNALSLNFEEIKHVAPDDDALHGGHDAHHGIDPLHGHGHHDIDPGHLDI
ncbi:MAG: hypothetical protein AB7J35_15565 [Dehalococcoidia bacterium]